MSQFVQVETLDTGTLKLEIYTGATDLLFLRISERISKDEDFNEWNEACLSADEAEQLRAFLSRALPPATSGDA
jgi:hypothetical protein